MAITSLPTPPSRSDPENFAERADAFMAALPRFANEANALQQDVTQWAASADNDATAAAMSANAAGASRAAASSSADAAALAQQGASQKASESRDSATLARQWAAKLSEPVEGGEFSARHYAQLAAQGMGLPIFPTNSIPTSNVGPIFVPGQGAMEWNGMRYVAMWAEHGQCRFLYVSSTECRLIPYNGNGLVINGKQYRIPQAGVALPVAAATGANGTANYAYAKDDGNGGIALEGVTTGHERHSDGVEVKTGDPTRTLVGVAFKNALGQFQHDALIRGVSSWFNRTYQSASYTNFSTGTASATPVQALGPISVWAWAGEGSDQSINGRTGVNIAGASSGTYMYLDGSQSWAIGGTSAIANATVPVSLSTTSEGLSEGLHSISTWLTAAGGSTSNCSLTQWIKARP